MWMVGRLPATVNEPDALELVIDDIDLDCNGDSDGSLTAQVSGGTAPYDYA